MAEKAGPGRPVIDIEELDYRPTPMGELILRRRRDPLLGGREIFEVKLGEDFLMSSLFTVAERALASLALAELAAQAEATPDAEQPRWEVVVGGLGLGYTALEALKDARVSSLLVIEALEAVIDWHQRGLVPMGCALAEDVRCRFVNDSFFDLAGARVGAGFDPEAPDRKYHAILLDIDHTPSKVLDPKHARFYSAEGLQALCRQLHPEGVFAMWSDDPPDAEFEALLGGCFEQVASKIVTFENPYGQGTAANTVYLAQRC